MSNLSDEYSRIIADIEKHISDPNERKYIMKKIEELSSMFIGLTDKLTTMDEGRIDELEKRQERIVATLSKLNETVDLIKKDIYEDEEYDFEIVCPYCNHEFVANVEDELKEEIECPECHNIIELDWDGNDKDEHGCSRCHGDCHSCGEFDDYDEKSEVDSEDNNEDDM